MVSDVKGFLSQQISIFNRVLTYLEYGWAILYAAGLVVLSFVNGQVGGMSPQMMLLLKLQIVGFGLGVLAALLGRGKHHPTFRSDVGIKGATKKGAMWAWIWLMVQVDQSIGLTGGVLNLRNTLVIAYNIYEAASIAETYINLGWYGHKAVEMMLVWRIDRLKEWSLAKIGGSKSDDHTGT